MRLQQAIEDTRHALDVAQREGNLEAAAELTYGKLPALSQDLAVAKDAVAASELLNEEMIRQHIAIVISNWTGIPVDKMLEGEREKLLAMEDYIENALSVRPMLSKLLLMQPGGRADLADQINNGQFLMLGPGGQ